MDLIVGHDWTERGDDALEAAVRMSAAAGGLSVLVVHVVTQQDLDKTGGLSADEKRAAAIERTYPQLWQRVELIADELRKAGLDHEAELDVAVRVAPVHLVRSQAAIAAILLEIARDFSATRMVLGRHGRPDCVAEHVLAAGELDASPQGATPGVLVVRVSAPPA